MLIPEHNHLVKISSLIATSYAVLQLENIELIMLDFDSIRDIKFFLRKWKIEDVSVTDRKLIHVSEKEILINYVSFISSCFVRCSFSQV